MIPCLNCNSEGVEQGVTKLRLVSPGLSPAQVRVAHWVAPPSDYAPLLRGGLSGLPAAYALALF